MILELHHVAIGQLIKDCSLMVSDGQLVCITGPQGAGKTTLLRAILGFIAIDGGHISIDGELVTPQSAPYFRRMTAYVPQLLTLPDDYEDATLERWPLLNADERYLLLLANAVKRNKPLLIVDEPPQPLSAATAETVDNLLRDAAQHGTSVLAVNSRILQNQITL